MDIHQLHYMVALSQELHFQRAAQKAHVTQPTLSQGIKNLEGELGTSLFERSSHKVRITPDGERFLAHAVAALDHLQKGILEVQKNVADLEGNVRLGVIPTICPYLLPKVILRLKKDAPRLTLELYEETTSVLLDFLKSGKIDLGLLALPVKDRAVVEKGLASEPFYLAVAVQHRLAKKRKVTRKDLIGEKLLVLQEGHCFREQALDFCKAKGEDTHVIFQGSSLTSVLELATSGEGVTFVPAMAVHPAHHADLVYLPFSPVVPTREIGVIWRLTAPLSPTQRFLIDILRQVLTPKP